MNKESCCQISLETIVWKGPYSLYTGRFAETALGNALIPEPFLGRPSTSAMTSNSKLLALRISEGGKKRSIVSYIYPHMVLTYFQKSLLEEM